MLKSIFLLAFVILVNSSSYDENQAKTYWFYASAGYCSQSKIENWNCGKACDSVSKLSNVKVFFNSTGSNSGFTAYDSNTNSIIILMRGTVPWNIKNWMDDLDFITVSYEYCPNGCKVHRSLYPNAQLTLLGHSLGGAMATHALVYFTKQQNVQVDKFYTFGSPRVGDLNFAQFLVQQVYPGDKYRLTHGRDPVPHLPMNSMSFYHINTEVFYKSSVPKGYIICNDQTSEDNKCSNQFWTDLMISDHNSYMDFDITVQTLTCQ